VTTVWVHAVALLLANVIRMRKTKLQTIVNGRGVSSVGVCVCVCVDYAVENKL
jgi:hypothetical protein